MTHSRPGREWACGEHARPLAAPRAGAKVAERLGWVLSGQDGAALGGAGAAPRRGAGLTKAGGAEANLAPQRGRQGTLVVPGAVHGTARDLQGAADVRRGAIHLLPAAAVAVIAILTRIVWRVATMTRAMMMMI